MSLNETQDAIFCGQGRSDDEEKYYMNAIRLSKFNIAILYETAPYYENPELKNKGNQRGLGRLRA